MSIDMYHMDGPVEHWVRDSVRKFYEENIYPNLTEHQRVLLVPGAFGSDVNRRPNGSYICDRACYDKMCAKDAVDFYDWAKSDSRVVGITPWNWAGCASCTIDKDEIGTRDLPATRAAWFTIGDKIKLSAMIDNGLGVPPGLKTDDGDELSFEITPSSVNDPIKSKTVEISAVVGAPPSATWLLVETVAGPQFSGLPFWFPLDAHVSSVTVAWWSEYFDRNDLGHDPIDPKHASVGSLKGKFTVALSAWKGRNGTRLSTAKKTPVVHYDKSYTALRWNLTAAPRGAPGTVRLTLTPADSISETLAADAKQAAWFRYKYISTPPNGVAQFAEDPTIEQFLQPPHFDLTISLGGDVYFVGIFGVFSNGISGGHLQGAPGFVSQRAPLVQLTATGWGFQPLALIVPFANGTLPSLPDGFKGPRLVLPPIPGDARLALHPVEDETYSAVTMFTGGTISMRLFYPSDESKTGMCEGACLEAGIELELPTCITLQNFSKNFKYSVVTAPSQPEAVDVYRVRLQTPPNLHGWYYYEQRAVWLNPIISCTTPSSQTVRIRALLTEASEQLTTNWQELQVSVKAVPKPPKKLPRRLAPSLTWTSTFHFAPNETTEGMEASIGMFRNVGMTTIPQDGCRNLQPSAKPQSYYTPAQRKSKLWEGLQYGPQLSSFANSFNGIGMYKALMMTQDEMDAFNASQVMTSYGLSTDQIANELMLIKNALEFYNATHHIDTAYRGFFFLQDLNVTRQIIEYTVPDFLFVDTESTTPWQTWLTHVGLSKNAAARRQPGEADADLAYRIAKEFMTSYNQTVRDASNGATALGFFASSASQNRGFGTFPWSILRDLGQLAQPGWYGQRDRKNLLETVNQVAAEKRATGHGPGSNRIIPWLSTGTSGPISPTECFTELVHMFLNGAGGFSYYSDVDFHDMEYYLMINKVVTMVIPFEDLIIDGALADVSSATNCVVSAMGLRGEFLIGVTSLDGTKPAVFEFDSNSTGEHILTDLLNDKPVQSLPSGKLSFQSTLAQTTMYRFAPNADFNGDTNEYDEAVESRPQKIDEQARVQLKSDDSPPLAPPGFAAPAASMHPRHPPVPPPRTCTLQPVKKETQ